MFQIKLKKLLGKNGGDGAQVGPASPKPPPFGFGWEDGYQYPTLFDEADEMLQASLLVYSITDLRSLARDPKKKTGLKSPEKILEMPLTLHTCLEMIEENIDAIEKEFGDVHADTMSTLRMIHERYERTAGGTGAVGSPARQWFNPFASDDGSVEVQTVAPALTSFGDENPDSDMVYCVGVDPIRKRVTVAFRGSVTQSDFMKDAKIALNLQPNPVRGVEKGHAHEKIGIHCGFYDYLLRPRKEGGNKLDEIVGHVRTLFVEMPERRRDYKLYVTGHSLGGALATLFSLYVAASLEETANVIPKPVCCFSVASPRVGDLSFQAAFRRLEELGLVRHLRIANDRDPVTMMPSASGKKMLLALSPISYLAVKLSDKQFAEKEHFRHTGVKLLLTKDSCEFSYMGHPMNTDDREETVDDETHDTSSASSMKSLSKSGKPKPSFRLNSIPDVAFHLGNAYTENLASVKSELLNLALNDLYSTSVVSIVAEHGN